MDPDGWIRRTRRFRSFGSTRCRSPDNFNMPQDGGGRRRVTKVPQFVTVLGGAYFFLPGLRTLSYFANQP